MTYLSLKLKFLFIQTHSYDLYVILTIKKDQIRPSTPQFNTSVPHKDRFHTRNPSVQHTPQFNTPLSFRPKTPQFHTKNPSVPHLKPFSSTHPSVPHQRPLSSTHPSAIFCVELRGFRCGTEGGGTEGFSVWY